MLTSGEKCNECFIISFVDFYQLVWGVMGRQCTMSKRYGECHHYNCHDFIAKERIELDKSFARGGLGKCICQLDGFRQLLN